MTMKRILMAAICAVAVAAVAAEGAKPARTGRPRGMSKPSGGIVEKAYSGKVIRVFDARRDADAGKFAETVRNIRWSAQLPVEAAKCELADGECPLAKAGELRATQGVGAAVLVLESDKLPIVLASPDARWAILNVRVLRRDRPEAEVYEKRVAKMLWNALAHALGAGASGAGGTALSPFSTLNELDSITYIDVGPLTHNAMIDLAATAGVRLIYFATYRTACQQGWAPKPDTEERQKIWDEVKSEKERGPANALQLKLPARQ